ncbi:TPA: hypothetical protein ACIKZP_000828 [Campylobacter jejuni]
MKIKNIKAKIIILWMQWACILYTRSANFYVKMDAARAVHRFKHDGEHRARVYVSLGKYF